MQYVPELTWILFLRVLDDKEQASQDEAEAVGAHFTPSLRSPYRWRDWASPGGAKRKELEAGKRFLEGLLMVMKQQEKK